MDDTLDEVLESIKIHRPYRLQPGHTCSPVGHPCPHDSLPSGLIYRIIGFGGEILRDIFPVYLNDRTIEIRIDEPIEIMPGQEIQLVIRRVVGEEIRKPPNKFKRLYLLLSRYGLTKWAFVKYRS